MDSNLVLLTLDLGIPKLWENTLVQKFPETSFVIRGVSFSGAKSFSGLLQIHEGEFSEIQKFLNKNFSNIMLNDFHSDSNLFFCLDNNSKLVKPLSQTKCIMNWPVTLQKDFKRIKLILNEDEVENILSNLENCRIDILSFSKVKVDFSFNEILTPKQKEILLPSIKYGYYEFPKKINLNCLAQKLNISPSTLCVHLQKIENRILNLNYHDLFFGV